MNLVVATNLAITVLIVYLGANLAILAEPRSLVDILRKSPEKATSEDDNNDLRTKKQWFTATVVGLGVVLFMSIMLALIAHPEWLEWLNRLLEPAVEWLQKVFTGIWLDLLACAVILMFMVLMLAPIKDALQKMSRKRLIGLATVMLGSIALAACFDNWVTANAVAVVYVLIAGISLQQRVSYLKLTLFMTTLAFVYDFVHVYLTGYMVKAAENMSPAIPGAPNPQAGGEETSSLNFPALLFLPDQWTLHPTHYAILGLGDVLSGILMAAGAARMGKWTSSKLPLLLGVAGYALGVYAAFAASVWFDSAQPALIFIVPITGALVICIMRLTGHHAELKRKPWLAPVQKAETNLEPNPA